MLVAKEAEIQKRTMEGGDSVDSCLWTTIPVQFVPVEACDEAMKWDRETAAGEDHIGLSLFCPRFRAMAAISESESTGCTD